jgi:hypothetical protein
MIIWDKNFIKPIVVKEEPIEAPFSVPETIETISELEVVSTIVETEDKTEQGSAGKGFGWSS